MPEYSLNKGLSIRCWQKISRDSDLTECLRNYAWPSHERGAAKTFLAIDDSDGIQSMATGRLSPAVVELSGPRKEELVDRVCGFVSWFIFHFSNQ